MDMCGDRAEEFSFDDIRQKRFELQPEYTSDDVRTILRGLTGLESIEYGWPLWIARHRNEEIWFAAGTNDGHCVMIQLAHIPRSTRKRGWKDYRGTNAIEIHAVSDSICQSLIQLDTKCRLIASYETQTTLLNLSVGIDKEFL